MRRIRWLLAAGLVALPALAVASPRPATESYSWSSSSGQGRLGIMVLGLTPELRQYFGAPDDRGVLVARVEPGTAAATAKLQPGDVIVEVKGKTVDSAMDIVSTLEPLNKGDAVAIELIRDHHPLVIQATMKERPLAGPANMPPAIRKMMRDMMRDFPDADWQHGHSST
jgi:membrane-associated protease RseP (regulator of RpoE activity)